MACPITAIPMKKCLLLGVLLLTFLPGARADDTRAQDAHRMEPYTVRESPFGFLGVRRASVSLNPLKWMVGMACVQKVQIDELDPRSPCIPLGVKPGDQITAINGVPVTRFGVGSLRKFGSELLVGQKVAFDVLRPSSGVTRSLVMVVAPRPKELEAPAAH